MFAWLFGGVFAAKLLASGVVLHCLIPYSSTKPLVVGPGRTEGAKTIYFHSFAWILGALLNVLGIAVHLSLASVVLPASFIWVLCLFAFLSYRLVAASRKEAKAWEPRDAAWYPQGSPKSYPHTLVSASRPTLSLYIRMADGCKLAADIWLPDDNESPTKSYPTIVHFTPCK